MDAVGGAFISDELIVFTEAEAIEDERVARRAINCKGRPQGRLQSIAVDVTFETLRAFPQAFPVARGTGASTWVPSHGSLLSPRYHPLSLQP